MRGNLHAQASMDVLLQSCCQHDTLPCARWCVFAHTQARVPVIEDVRWHGDDQLLVAYYGGVTLFSAQPGTAGMMFEHGVSSTGAPALADVQQQLLASHRACIAPAVHRAERAARHGRCAA